MQMRYDAPPLPQQA